MKMLVLLLVFTSGYSLTMNSSENRQELVEMVSITVSSPEKVARDSMLAEVDDAMSTLAREAFRKDESSALALQAFTVAAEGLCYQAFMTPEVVDKLVLHRLGEVDLNSQKFVFFRDKMITWMADNFQETISHTESSSCPFEESIEDFYGDDDDEEM